MISQYVIKQLRSLYNLMKNHKPLTTESFLVDTKDLFKLAQSLIGKARHEIRAGKEVKLNHLFHK